MDSKKIVTSIASAFVLLVSMSSFAGDTGEQAATMIPKVAPTPGALEYLTDIDNEDNFGGGVADGDMDVYIFNDNAVHPIEFNIKVGVDPTGRSASLRMDVYDIDAAQGEIDDVYVNGTKVGTLNGADGEWFVNVFQIPQGVLVKGNNTVQIMIDINDEGWATEIDWGMISLGGNKQVTIDKGYLTPVHVQSGGYANIFAEISGPQNWIGSVELRLKKDHIAWLTDPDGDGVWSGQVYADPSVFTGKYNGALNMVVRNNNDKLIASWPSLVLE